MLRKDGNMNVGSLLLYVKENICSKLEKTDCFAEENQVIAMNLVFLIQWSYFLGIYKPLAQNDLSYQS